MRSRASQNQNSLRQAFVLAWFVWILTHGVAHAQAAAEAFETSLAKARQALEQRAYATAETQSQHALQIAEQMAGKDSAVVERALALLSRSLILQGKQAQAEPHAKRAVRILQEEQGVAPERLLNAQIQLALCLNGLKKFAAAERVCRQALAIHNANIKTPTELTARLYRQLGLAFLRQRQAKNAEKVFRSLQVLRLQLTPADDIEIAISYQQLADAINLQKKNAEAEPWVRKSLARYRKHEKISPTKLSKLRVAGSLWNLGANLRAQGVKLKPGQPERDLKLAEAEERLRQSLAIRREQGLPPSDASILTTLTTLASTLEGRLKFKEAEGLYREIWETHKEHHGAANPRTIKALNRYVGNVQSTWPFREVEPLMRQAIKQSEITYGEDSDEVAAAKQRLARRLDHVGRFVESLAIQRELLKRARAKHGELHAATASCHNTVGLTLSYQNKPAEAERHIRAALKILEQLGLEDTLGYGTFLHNLSGCLDGQGRFEEAIACSRQAIKIHEAKIDEPFANVSLFKNSLAHLLSRQGKHAEAAAIYAQLVEVWKLNNGPSTLARANLAITKIAMHEFEEARTLLIEVLRLHRQRNIGVEASHGSAVSYRYALAVVEYFLGRPEESIRLLREAEAYYRTLRGNWALSGLDRSIAGVTHPSRLLAAILAEQGDAREAWRKWESTRGLGLLEEAAYREQQRLAGKEKERRRSLLARIRDLEAKLAAGSAEQELDEKLESQLASLQQQRAAIEQELVSLVGHDQTIRFRELQAALPADAAMIGWLEPFPTIREGVSTNHWGVVIRKVGEPRWVRLPGSRDGEWTTADRQLTAQVTEQLGETPARVDQRRLDNDLQRLKQLRMEPLLPLLTETRELPAATKLIVIPSKGMSGLPVQLLTTDLSVTYAPSAKAFLWLKQRRRNRADRAAAPTMFAIADPIFIATDDGGAETTAEPLPLAVRSSDGLALTELPGTRREVAAIETLFDQVGGESTLLLGEQATEAAVRSFNEQASLEKYQYIHIATHGVVNPLEPLESSLLLTEPSDGVAREEDPVDDARLTAGEMLASWRLRADLVTLSACQTALGRYAEGEGHIGFAQSLLLAGADSVLLSLWKVDDAATALLMQRFYQNVLGERPGLESPLAKDEALREAQSWLRDLPKREAERLIQGLPKAQRGTKTRRVRVPRVSSPTSAERPFAAPNYWSAFILIGRPD